MKPNESKTAMTEKGIRVYINRHGIVWTADAPVHQHNGYAFTDQQLAELKREIWDAARELYVQAIGASGTGQIVGAFDKVAHCYSQRYESLSDYESKKGGQDDQPSKLCPCHNEPCVWTSYNALLNKEPKKDHWSCATTLKEVE